jgi:hypothetical protein
VSTVPFAAAWLVSAIGPSAPIAGLLGMAGLTGGVVAMMDRLHRREAVAFAIAEIAKGRLDEAEWWARTVGPARGKRATDSVTAVLLRADVAWRRGDFEEADALLDEAARAAGTAPDSSRCHWLLASRRAQLAAVRGDVGDSLQALTQLPAGDAGDAGINARFTGLVVAFHTEDLRALPDDLERWVDETLRMAPGPVELALLAWACDAIGDRERTADVLARAGGTLDLGEAATRYPALARWIVGFEPRVAYR